MTARAKGRTVRAWAVVCAWRENPLQLYDTRKLAELEQRRADRAHNCGPHTVVALTGTFQPKAKAAKKGKGKR